MGGPVNIEGLSDECVAAVAGYCTNARSAASSFFAVTPHGLKSTGLSPDQIVDQGIGHIHGLTLVQPDLRERTFAAALHQARDTIGDVPRFDVTEASLSQLNRKESVGTDQRGGHEIV